MRILYIGSLWVGGTCYQRMQAMQDLGHDIVAVDTEPEYIRDKSKQILYRVSRKLFGPHDLAYANEKIIESIKKVAFNVLWLDKALTIKPETLRTVRQVSPKAVIVGYSPDDMARKHNQSRAFLKNLRLYDAFFTTKSYGVEELKDLGTPRAFFIDNAYDPHTHRPVNITEEEKRNFGGPVGFIGDYEFERAESMFFLAKNGISIRIWGPNWGRKCRLSHRNMIIENKPLWGEDYAKAICAFDINLAFLRKINRDLQTTRSVEIPACGAFMLAERTDEHMKLFEEGKEAEFFSTNEELLEKVRYYENHPEKRLQIAQNVRARCLKSGYSNHARISNMLAIVKDLLENDQKDSDLSHWQSG